MCAYTLFGGLQLESGVCFLGNSSKVAFPTTAQVDDCHWYILGARLNLKKQMPVFKHLQTTLLYQRLRGTHIENWWIHFHSIRPLTSAWSILKQKTSFLGSFQSSHDIVGRALRTMENIKLSFLIFFLLKILIYTNYNSFSHSLGMLTQQQLSWEPSGLA